MRTTLGANCAARMPSMKGSPGLILADQLAQCRVELDALDIDRQPRRAADHQLLRTERPSDSMVTRV